MSFINDSMPPDNENSIPWNELKPGDQVFIEHFDPDDPSEYPIHIENQWGVVRRVHDGHDSIDGEPTLCVTISTVVEFRVGYDRRDASKPNVTVGA